MKNETSGFTYPQKILGCSVVLLFLCLAPLSAHAAPGKIRAVTSLFPLYEFANAVGADRVQVELMLPPGAEPHHWEPKPGDAAKVYQADVFIYTDRNMEPWTANLLKGAKSPRLKILEAGQGLALLHAHEPAGAQQRSPSVRNEGSDPHFWMDFVLDMKVLDALAACFSEKDPSYSARFQANAEAYKKKLEALDQRYRSALSRCRQHEIILGGHSAFAYLAGRYGLKQTALYGVSADSEPTPKKLASVIERAKEQGAKFIFFEGLVNPKLARVLAEEAGLGTLPLYDGANLTREQVKQKISFLDLMEINLASLRRGLACE